jgi:predicted DNA-binding ribbon-helix-helix protein
MNPGAGSRRTLTVGKRRVRLTLEQEFWSGLTEIAEREGGSAPPLA